MEIKTYTTTTGKTFEYRTRTEWFGNGLPFSKCTSADHFEFIEQGERWGWHEECYADTEDELFAYIEKWFA